MKNKISLLLIAAISVTGFSEDHFRIVEALKERAIKGYSVFQDQKHSKGLIVIFDGFPDSKSSVEESVNLLFRWTKIPSLASKKHIVTIVIPYSRNLFITDSLYDIFQICIRDAFRRFDIPSRRYITGGFSAGGAMAVGLAENLVRDNKSDLIPKAVFAVDPVLELNEYYKARQRAINGNCGAPTAYIAINEAKELTRLLESTIGTPEDSHANYRKFSPFFMPDRNGGNAKFLHDVPIRLYHELDPMWSIKERCRSIFDENGPYGCAMIHSLYLAGNKNAEVILTQNRGSRVDGTRHPHSWNIVDEKDFMKWAQGKLQN